MGFNPVLLCINLIVLVWSLEILFCMACQFAWSFWQNTLWTMNLKREGGHDLPPHFSFFFRQGFHFWECQMDFLVPVMPCKFVDNCVGKLYNSSLVGFAALNIIAEHTSERETDGAALQSQKCKEHLWGSAKTQPSQTFLPLIYVLVLHSSVNAASGLHLPQCDLVVILPYGTHLFLKQITQKVWNPWTAWVSYFRRIYCLGFSKVAHTKKEKLRVGFKTYSR